MRDSIQGAKWWKFDFHTHTPASHDYGKNNPADKNVLAKDWLLNLMSKGIDCVAVTDHNTGAWIDSLKIALTDLDTQKPSGYRPLHLFPGVEISVNGGIHLLAIFDQSKTSADIASLLGAVGYKGAHGATDVHTEKSFETVVEEIFKSGGIAIPAHVDKESGLFTIQGNPGQGPTLTRNLQLSGLLAIELVDPAFSKPQIYKDLGLQLSEVLSSDSHDLASAGRKYTWVKMETPTFDALRLSLHDGDDGVLRSDLHPDDPNEKVADRFYIKSIKIKDGVKAGRGRPLEVHFSPWFTTLIGGRGSGKSSILSYLRLALNKKQNLTADASRDFEQFNQIGSRDKPGMLMSGTEIFVTLRKDRRDIDLKWAGNSWYEVVPDGSGGVKDTDPGDMEVRFPIRIYSQKQLFEMTKDASVILKLVDEQIDKRTWQDKLYSLESEVLDLKKKKRDVARQLTASTSYKKELDDVNAKIKLYEDSGHKELLGAYSKDRAISTKLDTIVSSISEYANQFEEVTKEFPVVVLPDDLDQNSKTHIIQVLDRATVLSKQISDISVELLKMEEKIKTLIGETSWAVESEKTKKMYDDLIEKLKSTGEKSPQGYESLIQLKNDLELKGKQREGFETQGKELDEKIKTKYTAIKDHHKVLRNSRMEVINTWNKSDIGKALRIKLLPLADMEHAENSFRSILRKTGTEFAKDIYVASDGEEASTGVLKHIEYSETTDRPLEDIFKARDQVLKDILVEQDSPVTKKFRSHIQTLVQNTPDDIDKLSLWFPEDKVSLSIVRDGKAEAIEAGSAGQRTAAMLGLLLSISDGPLLIDQPEDDLDTRLISDLVVQGLRKLKLEQQVVVVTHNPNIPVNGGAEHIVELRYAGGQIQRQSYGGLQRAEVRMAVCEIMEGGQIALDKRYYRVARALKDRVR